MSSVPSLSFCSISLSPPSWLEPIDHDLGLAAELGVGALRVFVGAGLEQRARLADMAELDLGLRKHGRGAEPREAERNGQLQRRATCR